MESIWLANDHLGFWSLRTNLDTNQKGQPCWFNSSLISGMYVEYLTDHSLQWQVPSLSQISLVCTVPDWPLVTVSGRYPSCRAYLWSVLYLTDRSLQWQVPSLSQIPEVCPRITQPAVQPAFPKVHLTKEEYKECRRLTGKWYKRRKQGLENV